jgi:hypothetical protein
MDHIIPQRDKDPDGHPVIQEWSGRTALVIYDLATRFTGCYPLKSKAADEAYNAIQHFRGKCYLQFVHTDNSGELIKAVGDLGFPHSTSTPGVHETNAVVERRNETILGGARTLLEHAGLPGCFWPLASAYFAHALNAEIVEGDSPWNLRHGKGHFNSSRLDEEDTRLIETELLGLVRQKALPVEAVVTQEKSSSQATSMAHSTSAQKRRRGFVTSKARSKL